MASNLALECWVQSGLWWPNNCLLITYFCAAYFWFNMHFGGACNDFKTGKATCAVLPNHMSCLEIICWVIIRLALHEVNTSLLSGRRVHNKSPICNVMRGTSDSNSTYFGQSNKHSSVSWRLK